MSCPLSDTAGCQAYCDFIGDCVVENATAQPVLAPQLEELGFGGDNAINECGGCLERCEADAEAGGAVDTAVLSCLSDSAAAAECGPGVEGAMPFIDGFNGCCVGESESAVCNTLCDLVAQNGVAMGFFEASCGTGE